MLCKRGSTDPSLIMAPPFRGRPSLIMLGNNSWRVFSSKRFANFDFSSNFEHSFTLQTWLRLASNFAKTRFRRSPTFHFSTSKNFFETSNGRLPPKHGSDRRETLPKRVSGDPRHFIFRHPQTFLATKIFVRKFFRQHPENLFSTKCLFWRSCAGLHATIECSSKRRNTMFDAKIFRRFFFSAEN